VPSSGSAVLLIEAESASKDFRSSSSEVVFHGGRLHNFENFEKIWVSTFQPFQTFSSSMEVVFLLFKMFWALPE
jgi:hypothetical protein